MSNLDDAFDGLTLEGSDQVARVTAADLDSGTSLLLPMEHAMLWMEENDWLCTSPALPHTCHDLTRACHNLTRTCHNDNAFVPAPFESAADDESFEAKDEFDR